MNKVEQFLADLEVGFPTKIAFSRCYAENPSVETGRRLEELQAKLVNHKPGVFSATGPDE